LLEHFYRRDPSRTRHEARSAGLGLTVVAAIIAAHGGVITADRGPLGGLRVAFTLPQNSDATDARSPGMSLV
ncbi:MAG: two-component sensor histidine kinase, partial [Gemmatimonadales bacterium]